jgi:hypothetical protein
MRKARRTADQQKAPIRMRPIRGFLLIRAFLLIRGFLLIRAFCASAVMKENRGSAEGADQNRC